MNKGNVLSIFVRGIAAVALFLSLATGVFAKLDKNEQPKLGTVLGSSDITDVVKGLKTKIHQNYHVQGWLLVREEIRRNHTSLFPNGTIVPESYIVENWYHINGTNSVDKLIDIRKTLDGQQLQVTVSSKNTSWNKTFKETMGFTPFDPDYFDNGTLNRITKYNNKHTVELQKQGDRQAVKISTTENLLTPVKFEGFDQTVTAVIEESIFDFSSGQLLTVNTRVRLEDGTELQVVQMTLEVTNKIVPPDDILDLLAEKENSKEASRTSRFGKVLAAPFLNNSKSVNSSVAGISTTSSKSITQGETWTHMFVSSYAVQSISQIGYSWWTIEKKCTNGTYPFWRQYGATYYTNANNFQNNGSIYYSEYPCGTTPVTYGNYGNHQYVQGSTQDYPRVDVNDTYNR